LSWRFRGLLPVHKIGVRRLNSARFRTPRATRFVTSCKHFEIDLNSKLFTARHQLQSIHGYGREH
jgi:hypothetical protein